MNREQRKRQSGADGLRRTVLTIVRIAPCSIRLFSYKSLSIKLVERDHCPTSSQVHFESHANVYDCPLGRRSTVNPVK